MALGFAVAPGVGPGGVGPGGVGPGGVGPGGVVGPGGGVDPGNWQNPLAQSAFDEHCASFGKHADMAGLQVGAGGGVGPGGVGPGGVVPGGGGCPRRSVEADPPGPADLRAAWRR